MKAISSMATRHVLADMNEAATAAGLPKVQIESVGGVDAATRVAAGERFDLVFLALDALQRLAAGGHVDPQSVTPLVRSQVAAAVGSSTDEPAVRPDGPAFADAVGMRDALLGANRIGYSTGPSGAALVEMIHTWGLADQLMDRLVQARPGVPVARSLAEGEVDLGFQQLSELVGQPGVRILGVLPADCAIETVFAGAVGENAVDPAPALELLRFLTSDSVEPIVQSHSLTRAT